MHYHCQYISSISQLELSSGVVRCSLYETRIDTTNYQQLVENFLKILIQKLNARITFPDKMKK